MEDIRDRYTLYFGDLDAADSIDLSKKFFSEFASNPPTIEDALTDLGVQANKSTLKEIPELGAVERNNDKIKKLGLTRDEAYAIGCYTLKFGICAKPLWEAVNEGLEGSRDRGALFAARKFLYLLLRGLRKLPRAKAATGKELYRVVREPVLLQESYGRQLYTIGNTVTWWGFTWATASHNVAKMLAEGAPESTIFTITGKGLWGYDVQLFSGCDECGVVLEPELKVTVKEVTQYGASLSVRVEAERFERLALEDIIPAVGTKHPTTTIDYSFVRATMPATGAATEVRGKVTLVKLSALEASEYIGPYSDRKEARASDLPSDYVWKKCPKSVDKEKRYTLDKKKPRVATLTAGLFGGCDRCTVIGDAPLPADKVTSWGIKILKSYYNNGSGISVGVAPSDIDQDDRDNYKKCGWHFYCDVLKLWSGPPHYYNGKKYGPEITKYIKTGDRVSVVMDTENGELSFAANGANLGIAYTGIPLDKPLVPCATIDVKGDSIRLGKSKLKENMSETITTPEGLCLKKLAWDSVTLSWDKIEGALFYQIEVDGSKFWYASTENIFTKRELQPDSGHVFRVRAIGKNDVGEWSSYMLAWVPEMPDFTKCVWVKRADFTDKNNRYAVNHENMRVVTKKSSDNYRTTIPGSAPLPLGKVVSWNIKILNSRNGSGKGIYIGVAPFDIDQHELDNTCKCGWYLYCFESRLYSGPPQYCVRKPYGPMKGGDGKCIRTGDSVGVVMDTTKGELSFVLDGTNWGVAYSGIPLDKPLVPCVLFWHEWDEVELII